MASSLAKASTTSAQRYLHFGAAAGQAGHGAVGLGVGRGGLEQQDEGGGEVGEGAAGGAVEQRQQTGVPGEGGGQAFGAGQSVAGLVAGGDGRVGGGAVEHEGEGGPAEHLRIVAPHQFAQRLRVVGSGDHDSGLGGGGADGLVLAGEAFADQRPGGGVAEFGQALEGGGDAAGPGVDALLLLGLGFGGGLAEGFEGVGVAVAGEGGGGAEAGVGVGAGEGGADGVEGLAVQQVFEGGEAGLGVVVRHGVGEGGLGLGGGEGAELGDREAAQVRVRAPQGRDHGGGVLAAGALDRELEGLAAQLVVAVVEHPEQHLPGPRVRRPGP